MASIDESLIHLVNTLVSKSVNTQMRKQMKEYRQIARHSYCVQIQVMCVLERGEDLRDSQAI